MFRDRDTGKVYTKWQLFKKWFALDEDILEALEDEGITTFDEWLDAVTDFSGSLERI